MGTYSELVEQSNQKTKESKKKKESLPQEEIKVKSDVGKQTSKQVSKLASKHVYIQRYLSEKAFVTGSFRLPPSILEKFDEIFYQTKAKYKSDAKRYSFVIVALGWLFWDFEKRGKESEIYKLLIEKTPQE